MAGSWAARAATGMWGGFGATRVACAAWLALTAAAGAAIGQTDDEGLPSWQRSPRVSVAQPAYRSADVPTRQSQWQPTRPAVADEESPRPRRTAVAATGYVEPAPAETPAPATSAGPIVERRHATGVVQDPLPSGSPLVSEMPPNAMHSPSFEMGEPSMCDACNGCESGCCGGCCGDHCHLWFTAEYLLWWTKGMTTPPLVTTGNTTNQAQAGVLGQDSTSVLFGGNDLGAGSGRSGERFGAGWWLDACQTVAIEGSYFCLGDASTPFSAASDGNGNPLLGRPYFNSASGAPAASLIAFPGVQSGQINIQATSHLDGFEVLLRKEMYGSPMGDCDFLIGYRYLRLADNLQINESTTLLTTNGNTATGTNQVLSDQFATNNEFQGLELGVNWSKALACRWSFDLLGKLAVGNTRSAVSVNGSTVTTVPTQAPVTTAGGVLAGPNSVQYAENAITAVPELGATLGFDLTPRLRATVGYSLLYWSRVGRAGEQINTNIPTPGGTISQAPYRFVSDDYWAHGLNAGLDFHF